MDLQIFKKIQNFYCLEFVLVILGLTFFRPQQKIGNFFFLLKNLEFILEIFQNLAVSTLSVLPAI